ncbi:MAG: cyclic nucleotide-binding domain-containing protein [Rhodospirillales bacterium]|nr:cyclic nucleotide-binding domain-containing protein [Rhodospirillales bacterium]
MADDRTFERMTFEPGERIFEQGKRGTFAYLIVSGEVEIRTSKRGSKPRTVARVGKGEVVGEMSLFDNEERMASGIAATTVDAIRLSRSEFRARLKSLDPVTKSVIKMLVKHFRASHKQLSGSKKIEWRRK